MAADRDQKATGGPSGAAGSARARYAALLDAFGAADRRPNECVRYLESQGLTHGQARNAVYRYRHERGLGKPRSRPTRNDSGSQDGATNA